MAKERAKRKVKEPEVFDAKRLEKELQREAKAVGLPENTAKVVSGRVAKKVAKWAENKSMITQSDLDRRIAQEAREYSQDLAYVYENRGKII